ncbi:MAG: glycosyltransferase family 39 protein [Acidobacteria bacterium]|nr:glycosyltransferase family 39 protein [Acidobacteriota bacterium]
MVSHRRFWFVTGSLAAAVLTAGAVYLAFGHAFVARAYSRGARATLRAIIPTWAPLPLGDFLAAADQLAIAGVLLALGLIALLAPGEYAQDAVGRAYDRLLRTCDAAIARPRLALGLLASATFIVLASIASLVLLRFPNSGDEYCYLYQVRAWLDGRAWYPEHPLQAFFEFGHVRVLDGRVFSVFPPGWPAVIYAAEQAGIPAWLVNPLLGALVVVVCFLVARRWYDARVALVATVVMAMSSFFLLNSASYYAHTFALLAVLLFASSALRGCERDSLIHGVIAGAAFAAAFTARFFTAVMCGLPFGLHYLRRAWRHWRFAAGFALGFLPIFAAFLWHNHALMSQWIVLPMKGFENYDARWFQSNLLTRGTDIALSNLWDWIVWTPGAVLPLYALAMRDRTGPMYQRLLGSVFLCVVAGYYVYVDTGGNRYGPRYYFEALPFVMLPATWLVLKESSWREKSIRARWYFYLYALSVVLAVPAFAWQAWNAHTIVYERTDLYRVVDESRVSNAIVFVATPTGTRWQMAATDHTRNWGRHDASVIYALDRGADNARLIDAFPGRAAYRYAYDPAVSRGSLERLR